MNDDVWDYCPVCDDWGAWIEARDGHGWVCAVCSPHPLAKIDLTIAPLTVVGQQHEPAA